MYQRRTDLAVESHALWRERMENTTKLEGVFAAEEELEGFLIETIHILDKNGEQALGKAKGHYSTLHLDELMQRQQDAFPRAARALAAILAPMLPTEEDAPVLVVGLGNRAITPDAIGPLTVEYTLITRHLREHLPDAFGHFRAVSALAAGVLGTTGVESGEIAAAVTGTVKPAAVIAVDALAARSMQRICNTVQVADTGIVPGSGIGNSRAGLTLKTLGVPVIAMGVPTVVEAGTLAIDLLEQAGQAEAAQALAEREADMIVTPKDIDKSVQDISKLVGYGINLALHPHLTLEDLDMFLS